MYDLSVKKNQIISLVFFYFSSQNTKNVFPFFLSRIAELLFNCAVDLTTLFELINLNVPRLYRAYASIALSKSLIYIKLIWSCEAEGDMRWSDDFHWRFASCIRHKALERKIRRARLMQSITINDIVRCATVYWLECVIALVRCTELYIFFCIRLVFDRLIVYLQISNSYVYKSSWNVLSLQILRAVI